MRRHANDITDHLNAVPIVDHQLSTLKETKISRIILIVYVQSQKFGNQNNFWELENENDYTGETKSAKVILDMLQI